jgi:hypothetical protein
VEERVHTPPIAEGTREKAAPLLKASSRACAVWCNARNARVFKGWLMDRALMDTLFYIVLKFRLEPRVFFEAPTHFLWYVMVDVLPT